MTIPRILEKPIDSGGLIIALIVDVVINVICFATLAPDLITSVAFVAIGVMIVLFVFRSWSRRQYIAWIVFVIVVFFFDYSFALIATKNQNTTSSINVYENQEVKRLQGVIELHNKTVTDLQAEREISTRAETIAQISAQIIETNRLAVSANEARDALISELKKQNKTHSTMKADDIFTAIPDAFADKRYIQLVIFGLIFFGLQLIITTSIDKPKRSDESEADQATVPADTEPPITIPAPTITLSDIAQFVTLSYFRVDQRTDTHILPESAFFDYMKKRNVLFSKPVYDYLYDLSIKLSIVDSDGVILRRSKEESIKLLEEAIG